MKLLSTLSPSLLLLLVAAYASQHLPYLSPAEFGLAKWGPMAIAAIGMTLSLRFNRSRIFFSLAVLATVYGALVWGVRGAPPSGTIYAACALLLPLNLVLFASLKERGILTRWGVARLALLAGQVALVAYLIHTNNQRLIEGLHFKLLREALLAHTRLPQPALLAFAVGGAWFTVPALRRPSAQVGGLLGALVAAGMMFEYGADLYRVIAFATAGALALTVTVVQESYSMAYIDELTSLPGRRALQEQMLKLGNRYAVAMLDVDHFKKFNDTHGHDVGDQVLRMVAARIRRVSDGGKAFRYGGEEFSIVFPGKNAEAVTDALDTVRRAVEDSRFTVRSGDRRRDRRGQDPGGRQVTVTISIGVADPGKLKEKADPWAVLKAADKALYQAKKKGRNRVCAA